MGLMARAVFCSFADCCVFDAAAPKIACVEGDTEVPVLTFSRQALVNISLHLVATNTLTLLIVFFCADIVFTWTCLIFWLLHAFLLHFPGAVIVLHVMRRVEDLVIG